MAAREKAPALGLIIGDGDAMGDMEDMEDEEGMGFVDLAKELFPDTDPEALRELILAAMGP